MPLHGFVLFPKSIKIALFVNFRVQEPVLVPLSHASDMFIHFRVQGDFLVPHPVQITLFLLILKLKSLSLLPHHIHIALKFQSSRATPCFPHSIQVISAFISEFKNLSLPQRVIHILQKVYSPDSEESFLELAMYILLEETRYSADYQRDIFQQPLTHCRFRVWISCDSILLSVDLLYCIF